MNNIVSSGSPTVVTQRPNLQDEHQGGVLWRKFAMDFVGRPDGTLGYTTISFKPYTISADALMGFILLFTNFKCPHVS